MTALDFPNSPTVGQQYTAPNGAVYTWDGAAWTVSGVISTGTAAGGSLTGTYPNPGIAALAVATAQLAVGATVAAQVNVELASMQTAPTGVGQLLGATLPSFRGGIVLVLVEIMGSMTVTDTAETHIAINIGIDSTTGPGRIPQVLGVTSMVNSFLPWSCNMAWITSVAAPSANRNVYVNWQRATGTGTWRANNGNLSVIGFA